MDQVWERIDKELARRRKTWPMTDAQRQAFMREWPHSMKDVATAFVLKKRAAAKR